MRPDFHWLTGIEYGIPWYKVEPRPGCLDWRWTDEAHGSLC